MRGGVSSSVKSSTRSGVSSGARSDVRSNAAKRLFRRWATLLLTGVAACGLLAPVHAGLCGNAPFDATFITLDAEPLAPSRWHGNHGLAAFGALPLPLGAAVLLLAVPVFLLGGGVGLMWRLAQGRAQPGSGVTP